MVKVATEETTRAELPELESFTEAERTIARAVIGSNRMGLSVGVNPHPDGPAKTTLAIHAPSDRIRPPESPGYHIWVNRPLDAWLDAAKENFGRDWPRKGEPCEACGKPK